MCVGGGVGGSLFILGFRGPNPGNKTSQSTQIPGGVSCFACVGASVGRGVKRRDMNRQPSASAHRLNAWCHHSEQIIGAASIGATSCVSVICKTTTRFIHARKATARPHRRVLGEHALMCAIVPSREPVMRSCCARPCLFSWAAPAPGEHRNSQSQSKSLQQIGLDQCATPPSSASAPSSPCGGGIGSG